MAAGVNALLLAMRGEQGWVVSGGWEGRRPGWDVACCTVLACCSSSVERAAAPHLLPHQSCSVLPDCCRSLLSPTTGRGTTEAAAPAERHYSLTGQHGVWARTRRLATLDFWFDILDEIFEVGDNVDLTVRPW